MTYTDDMRLHDRTYAELCVARTLMDMDTQGKSKQKVYHKYLNMILSSEIVYDVGECTIMYDEILYERYMVELCMPTTAV